MKQGQWWHAHRQHHARATPPGRPARVACSPAAGQSAPVRLRASAPRHGLGADLRLYPVDIVAGLAFGTDVNTIGMGEHVILQGVARRTMMPFPYWRYVKLPADRRLERSVVVL